MAEMTKAMRAALKWLADRGGDAAFDRNGVALAMGDSAPVARLPQRPAHVIPDLSHLPRLLS